MPLLKFLHLQAFFVTLFSSTSMALECSNEAINFNNINLKSYSNQNADNSVTIIEEGCSVYIADNSWVATSSVYNITEDTTLEFGYIGSGLGEIHGIGFDNNLKDFNDDNMFNVFGTQKQFGLSEYRYQSPGTYQLFSIPVGKYFTGEGFHLVLAMDQDIPSNAAGYFTNIRLVNKKVDSQDSMIFLSMTD